MRKRKSKRIVRSGKGEAGGELGEENVKQKKC